MVDFFGEKDEEDCETPDEGELDGLCGELKGEEG